MKKNSKIVVANWKANPESLKSAKQIFQGLKKINSKAKGVEIIVCPSYVHLAELKKARGSSSVGLGAQDFFPGSGGAFTGYVGYESLLDLGVKYAIIGHSERRAGGETNEIIAKKMETALLNGVSPILCVGEEERDGSMAYLDHIKNQLIDAFYKIPKAKVSRVMVAYEPLWAIGKSAKRSANPSEIQEIVIFIKRVLSDLYKTRSVPPIKVLYGGSVSPSGAAEMFSLSGVDGFLVGRASLLPKDFSEIVMSISAI